MYRRATGEPLIKGFAGDRADLDREMAKSAFVAAYNRPRQRAALLSASDLPMSTLGGLVFWFTNGDIDRKDATAEAVDDKAGYPKWKKLAAATRKDYLDAFDYLRPEFDIIVTDITQSDLYDLRDKCAQSKWARFADQMISALSTMFTQGVKRGNRTGMTINPCRGMDKAHAADPNANREWFKNELPVALQLAPLEIKIRSCLPDTAVCADKASWSRDGNSISRTILPERASALSRERTGADFTFQPCPNSKLSSPASVGLPSSSRYAMTEHRGRAKRRCRPPLAITSAI